MCSLHVASRGHDVFDLGGGYVPRGEIWSDPERRRHLPLDVRARYSTLCFIACNPYRTDDEERERLRLQAELGRMGLGTIAPVERTA